MSREKEKKRLRQYLNPSIRGPKTDIVLDALSCGAAHLIDNVEAVNDQLYIVSAEGRYLDELLAGRNITRPDNVGLSDEVFREIGIEVSTRKQVVDLVHEILRVMYGEEFIRASISAQELETYELEDGDTLIISFDDQDPVEVTFSTNQFSNIVAATAQEVADAITKEIRRLGRTGAALAKDDGAGGYVLLISETNGPSSSIKVLGGKAQNKLKFSEIRPTGGVSATQWTLTQEPGGTIKATWTGGPDPSLGVVRKDDYVNIFGTAFEPENRGTFTIVAAKGGTVGQAFVEWENPAGVPETTAQGTDEGILFFNPRRFTLNSKVNYAAAYQTENRLLEVFIPATTKVVRRDRVGAAYVQNDGSVDAVAASFVGTPQGATDVIELIADTTGIIANGVSITGNETIVASTPIAEQVGFSSNFGWSGGYYGQTFTSNATSQDAAAISFKIGNNGNAIGTLKYVVYETSGGVPTGAPIAETNSITLESLPVGSGADSVPTELTLTTPLTLNPSTTYGISMQAEIISGTLQFAVEPNNYAGGSIIFDPSKSGSFSPTASFDAFFSVNTEGTAVKDTVDELVAAYNLSNPTNTISVVRGGSEGIDDGITITLLGGTDEILPTSAEFLGPYTFDTAKPYIIGGEECNTLESIDANTSLIIEVDNATNIPDEQGNLIFGFGTSKEEGPVPYISRPSTGQILLNPSYSFENRHDAGTNISLVAQNFPYDVTRDGSDFPFYITDVVSGRVYAEELVNLVAATGIQVVITVLYPNDIGLAKAGTEFSDKFYVWGSDPV